MVPFSGVNILVAEMEGRGFKSGLSKVVGAEHGCALDITPGDDIWLERLVLGH